MDSVETRLSDVEKKLSDLEARFEERSKTLFNRINDLGIITNALNNLTASVREIAYRMGAVEKRNDSLGHKIEVLEGAPGKKWNVATTAIITAIISGAIGFIVAKIFS